MSKFAAITSSLGSDLKHLKKDTAVYTTLYIAAVFLSNTHIFIKTAPLTASVYINIFTIIVLFLQMINAVYFQQAYTKQKIPFIEFNPLGTVIFHTYRIVFLQILMLIPIMIIFILFMTILVKIITFTRIIAVILKLTPIIIAIAWAARLLFIQMLLVYKRDTFKMNDIVSESKEIFKNNLFIVLPLFLLLYLPAGYMLYTFFSLNALENHPHVSWTQIIVPAVTGYISSLFYFKLVIEHQRQIMSRLLPPPRGS